MSRQKKENDLVHAVKGGIEALRKGRGLRLSRVTVIPPPKYTAKQISVLRREKLRMSQAIFALHLGVGISALRSWEQGWRDPSMPARRLIQLAARKPKVFRELATAVAP